MTTYGDPFTTTLPAVGAAGPQYATDLDSILTDIMGRLAAKVPLASLLVTSDLNLNGFNASNVNYLGLVNNTAAIPASPSTRLTAFLGDLYYVSPSGTVQLTTGAALNTSTVGGITGDYGGVNPAQFRMDAANTRYDAYTNFVAGTWAYLRGLGFDIAGSTTSLARARLLWAGTVNQAYTLPAAAPVATTSSLLQMDTSGNITVSNALPTNANLTLAGTGHVARGTRTTTVPIHAVLCTVGGGGGPSTSGGLPGAIQPTSSDVYYQINLPDADNGLTSITNVSVQFVGGAGVTMQLYTGFTNTFSLVAGSGGTGATPITYTPTSPFVPTSGQTLWLRVQTAANSIAFSSVTLTTTVS